jgi:LysM repeat protein
MNKSNVVRVGAWLLLVALVASLLIGCSAPVAADVTTSEISYTGALDVSYEDALDATSQLALGTLRLERTADAVTEAQAAALLPLWQALQGGELQGESEQYAVLRQIEATMTGAQVAAIAELRLTTQDAQGWLETQEAAATDASEQASGNAKMPAGMPAGMSEEQLVRVRAQVSGVMLSGRSASQVLTREVIELLVVRSGLADEGAAQPAVAQVVGQATDRESTGATEVSVTKESSAVTESSTGTELSAVVEDAVAAQDDTTPAEAHAAGRDSAQEPESLATECTESVVYVVQAGDSLVAIAAAYGVTVEAIVEANGIEDPNAIYAGQALIIAEPGRIPEPAALAASAQAESEPKTVASTTVVGALEWLPDTDPGPPFTIEVSANRATQDPLVEQSQTYLVTGVVRNDGDRTYAVSDVLVTFYDAEGFRGTFDPAIRDGKLVGGEWNWHGQTEAEFAALLLAPGEAWPFRVSITAQDMASFLIHPDAAATERESVPVEWNEVRLVNEGTAYVRISGTATNANAFKVKNVTATGVLLDGNGQIVSLGSVYVLQEGIEPGDSVQFDIRVEKEPYATYQLYAQAERDWD